MFMFEHDINWKMQKCLREQHSVYFIDFWVGDIEHLNFWVCFGPAVQTCQHRTEFLVCHCPGLRWQTQDSDINQFHKYQSFCNEFLFYISNTLVRLHEHELQHIIFVGEAEHTWLLKQKKLRSF